jgi:hypothetical protein
MDLLVLGGLLSLIANLSLGIFVLTRNPKSSINRDFFLLSISIGFWSVGSFTINSIGNSEISLTLLRCSYLFAIIIPFLFIRFVYSILEKDLPKAAIVIEIVVMMALLVFLPTNLFIKALKRLTDNTLISSPGPVYYLLISNFVGVAIYSYAILFMNMYRSVGIKRLQLIYISVAYCIAFISGMDYFASVLEFLHSFPIDDYILLISFLILAYAIIDTA